MPNSSTAGSTRDDRWLNRFVLGLLVAFVVIAVGTPLLGVTVFAGSDLMMPRAPWNTLVPTGFQAQNPYVGDTVDGLIPASRAFSERLRDGDVASWWSLNNGGGELLSTNAVLSPISLPYLILPISLAPGYVKLLELVVSIGGVFLFLRRIGLSRSASLLAGLVFVSSAFMVVWTSWPHTKVAAFIPVLFWAIERLVQRGGPADVALVAAAAGSMLLGGFPSVAAYGFALAAVYLVVRLAVVHGWRPSRIVRGTALAGAGVGLGVAIAAIALLPFVRELAEVAVGPRDQGPENHSPLISMITMIAPDALGGITRGAGAGWFGLGHPMEQISFLGIVPIALTIVGAVARRRPGVPPLVGGFFALATAGTLVVVFIGGPLLAAVQQIPIFDMSSIGRARSILGFLVAVLAGIGFDALVRRATDAPQAPAWRRRVRPVVVVVAWVGVAAAGAYIVLESRQYAFGRGQAGWFDSRLAVPVVVGVVALIAALVAWRARGLARAVALGLVPLLVAGPALSFVLPFWPRVPHEQFYPPTPTHTFLTEHVGPDRMITAGTMQAGTEAFYGLRTVGGRSFVAADYNHLLRAWCSRCFFTPTYMQLPADPTFWDDPLLDRLGARYLVADPGAMIAGRPDLTGSVEASVRLEPGTPTAIALPGGPIRAVGLVIADPYVASDPWASLDVEVLDSGGTTLQTVSRRLLKGSPAGPFVVAFPEDATDRAATAVVTLHADHAMDVRAGADGQVASWVVRPIDDGLEVVHGGDTTIYERTTALPRIRWASSMVVEEDPARAVDLVLSGRAPDLVLETPADPPSGDPADLTVIEDSGDTMVVEVDAVGLGYLVVADGLLDRWRASVDGEPARLLAADHGYVAVAVPAGRHEVRLEYVQPLSGAGYLVSAGAALVLIALLVLDRAAQRSVPSRGMQPAARSRRRAP